MPNDLARALDHGRLQIANAVVETHPFLHFYVEAFPARLSQGHVWLQEAVAGFVQKADDPTRSHGSRIGEVEGNHALYDAVVSRFPEAVAGERTRVVAWPVRDLPGYQIEPHTDVHRKLITVIFYLSGAGPGTSLYVPKDRNLRSVGDRCYSRSLFHWVKEVPRREGWAFGFARSDQSWHGVEPSPAFEGHRDSLFYTIYRKDPI